MSTKKENELDSTAELCRQMDRGNLFLHDALSRYAARTNELQGYLQIMLDLMLKKEMLSTEEIENLLGKALENALKEGRNLQPGIKLRVEEEIESENISPVNCEERIHICKAVCCQLDFALSTKEVESGKVKWDLGRPYMIRQNKKGYCCHNSDENSCLIYSDRPFSCQKYNCTHDERIWSNFDKMELNKEWISKNVGHKDPLQDEFAISHK